MQVRGTAQVYCIRQHWETVERHFDGIGLCTSLARASVWDTRTFYFFVTHRCSFALLATWENRTTHLYCLCIIILLLFLIAKICLTTCWRQALQELGRVYQTMLKPCQGLNPNVVSTLSNNHKNQYFQNLPFFQVRFQG